MFSQVVVFDLDDTLYKEIDYVRSGFSKCAAFLSQLGYAIVESDFFKLYEQNPSSVFQTISSKLDQFPAHEWSAPQQSQDPTELAELLLDI